MYVVVVLQRVIKIFRRFTFKYEYAVKSNHCWDVYGSMFKSSYLDYLISSVEKS